MNRVFITVILLVFSVACKKKIDAANNETIMSIGGDVTIKDAESRWILTIRNNKSSAHFDIVDKDGQQCVFDLYDGKGEGSGLSYRGGTEGPIIILNSKQGVVSSTSGSQSAE
jgi:hypothetical protein